MCLTILSPTGEIFYTKKWFFFTQWGVKVNCFTPWGVKVNFSAPWCFSQHWHQDSVQFNVLPTKWCIGQYYEENLQCWATLCSWKCAAGNLQLSCTGRVLLQQSPPPNPTPTPHLSWPECNTQMGGALRLLDAKRFLNVLELFNISNKRNSFVFDTKNGFKYIGVCLCVCL